jgi:hypothetical protein
MSKSLSQVQVSIVASLGQGFNAAFTSADRRMQQLGKSAQALSRQVGNIDGFRKQQEAVKQAGYQWQAAKAKADQLRQAIAAQGVPTRAQTAELRRLERATEKAGGAFSQQRTKLAEMGRELQKAGVNVGKLSTEYERLQTQLKGVTGKHEAMERSLARQQRMVQGMSNAWGAIQRHASGAVAAGAVVGMAARKALPYDEQLARLADTATAGGSQEQFKGSKTQLSQAIQAALKSAGGGSREEVLAGLNTLIATGGMSTQDAVAMLPMIARGSFASGAGGSDIAGLALKMKGFGVDASSGLDIAMRGGQVGGVELRDMAKYLPEQLASARSAGYSGNSGLASIVAMNQIALGTAGNPEQAANNVTNLLNKLSSPELAKNISKVAGVDFDKYALGRAQKGVFKAEAFAEVADKEMMSNPAYRALKKRAEGAKGGEQSALISNMASMMEGSGMGQLIQDRQALAAALAMMFARRKDAAGNSELGTLTDKILNGQGGIAGSAARLQGETFAKTQMAGENLNAANETAFNALSGPMGKVLDGFNSMTEAFPKLTAAAYGAVTALTAIAAWGLVGGAVGRLAGGAAGGAAAGAAGTAAAGAGAGAAAARLGVLGRLGVAGMLGWGAVQAGEATGLLKQNDEQRGKDAFAKGNIMEASRYMSAGSFIGSLWGKATGGDSEAAAKSAQAASEAAKAAQSRPNVTMTNSYSLSVTAGPEAGSAQAAAEIMRAIKLYDKQREADARSSMFGRPEY